MRNTRQAGKGAGYHETKEKARSAVETRRCYLTTNVGWFEDRALWPGLRSFVCCVKTVEPVNGGPATEERRYCISSLTGVEACADAIRGHWAVENSLHWVLDAHFNEDGNMTVDRNASQNYSLMNKMAAGLLRLVAPVLKPSIRRARKITGWDTEGALRMLCAIDGRTLEKALGEPRRQKPAGEPGAIPIS